MQCIEPGCKSPFGSKKYGGYCSGHAQKRGLLKRKPIGKGKELTKKLGKYGSAAKFGMVGKYVVEIISNEGEFDAAEVYYPLKNRNPVPGDKYGSEKWTFALWLLADGVDRKPIIESELAKLFGIPTYLLGVWKRSDWIKDIFESELDKRLLSYRKIIDLVVFSGAAAGDRKAQELFYKRIDRVEDKKLGDEDSSDKKEENLPSEMSFGIEYEGEDIKKPGVTGVKKFLSKDGEPDVFDNNEEDGAYASISVASPRGFGRTASVGESEVGR